jgi:hypothetical protein
MQEPAGGSNHGHRAPEGPTSQEGSDTRWLPLGVEDWQAAEFMRDNGWTVARVKDPALSGMAAHRGVLHPDDHVDTDALQAMVESEFGFSCEQVHAVYRQGPLTSDQRELRGSIDARVLALSRSGTNLALLGQALGFPVKANGNCRAMENALARARKESE